MLNKYRFLLVAIVVSCILMFSNLGDRYMWGDESYAASWAKNILKYGYPRDNDGKNIIGADIYGNSIYSNKDDILVYNPWAENYIIAFSFLIFGTNTFAARFPFALFGILTIPLLYFFALKITKNKKIANLSIFLLALYIPFYLYSRTARYHSLTMLLSLLVLFSYFLFLENKKYSGIFFVILGVLLFYTHYIPFFAVYSAIIIHFLLFKFNKEKFKKIISFSIAIFILTFPWFVYANVTSKSAGFSLPRIIFGFAYLFAYISLYLFPILLWLLIPKILFRKIKGKLGVNQENFLIIMIILFAMIFSIFGHSELPSFRYLVFLFPLVFILIAEISEIIFDYNKYVCIALILILIFSNYLFILPFKPFEQLALNKFEKDSNAYLFIKDNLRTRYFLFQYIQEIMHHYSTPEEKILVYLKKNAENDDIFLSPEISDTIIFYLDLVSYRTTVNKTPDWVIPLESYSLFGNINNYIFSKKLINNNHRKVIIHATDYIYPVDSPDPRTHRFTENREMRTSKIYPQETYPIYLYILR